MQCKICNTRVAGEPSHCPNCGTSLGGRNRRSSSETGQRPVIPFAKPSEPEEIELASEDAIEPLEVSVKDLEETKPDVPARAGEEGPESDLRAILAAHPEALESGLTVHSDGARKQLGVGYRTEVGEIDLLARDGSGAYVVVMIATAKDGETTVREILQRIGWVRKNLAKGDRVRGTVLLEQAPENLSYLAAAVADTVAFRTYRVSVVFDTLDV